MERAGNEMSFDHWRRMKGQAQRKHLWQQMVKTDRFYNMAYCRDHCRRLSRRRDTWHARIQAENINFHFKIWRHHLGFTALLGIYGDSTTTRPRQYTRIMGKRMKKVYLLASHGTVSIIISSGIFQGCCISWERFGHQGKNIVCTMETGRCISIKANQELQTAKKMYDTRTSARNKRKIADLEASVKEEELQRTEEDITEEVD